MNQLRHTVSLLLVLVYTGGLFSPLLPWVDYFLNFDKFSTFYCINQDRPQMKCNGMCHVRQRIGEQSRQEEPSPQAPESREQLSWHVVVSPRPQVDISERSSRDMPLPRNVSAHSQYQPLPVTPPPRLL